MNNPTCSSQSQINNIQIDPHKQLITATAADAIADLKRKTREQMVREGTFPKPVKVGTHSIRFVLGEVLDWVEERKAQREAS